MVQFSAEIERFEKNGEKTGWFYIVVPEATARKIKADNRQFFRVRGTINGREFAGLGLIPTGDGGFILAVNAGIRKTLEAGLGEIGRAHSELQSLMRISYAVFCLTKKN